MRSANTNIVATFTYPMSKTVFYYISRASHVRAVRQTAWNMVEFLACSQAPLLPLIAVLRDPRERPSI